MGIFNTMLGSKPKKSAPSLSLEIDLGQFKCSNTVLGTRPESTEPFADYFDSEGKADLTESGLELGIKAGVLDYAFVTLATFTGEFKKNGVAVSVSTASTPEEIVSQFGEPYWTDFDSKEKILFYEYQGGEVELQFEFPGPTLGFVTLMRNGVLSQANDRKSYGVTKPWPPK